MRSASGTGQAQSPKLIVAASRYDSDISESAEGFYELARFTGMLRCTCMVMTRLVWLCVEMHV